MLILLIWSVALTVTNASKSQGIIERDALGETLTIGTFYDARKSLMLNGASFWSQEVLEDSVVSTSSVYSTVDIDTQQNIHNKAYKLDVDASLQLGIMSGQIDIEGSGRYLRDEKDNNDVARAVLTYRSTKKTDVLPKNTVKSFPEMCERISDEKGPTHVVSSIQYGLRAHFVFDRNVGDDEYTQNIMGELKIKLNNLPNFKLNASALVNITEEDKNEIEKTHIKFYGDSIPTKMPGTYDQVKETFDEINEQAKDGDILTPIKYQLTPIGYYCDGIDAVLIEISHDLSARAINILSELTSMKTRVKTLLNTEPALRFTSIRKQLLTFQSGLAEYTSDKIERLSTLIPDLKAGTEDESAFSELIIEYDQSVWNKERAGIFLDHRTREINTIQLVTDKAHTAPSVVLSDRGAATDNKCIFTSKYATVYQLHVLPSEDIAEQFSNGNYNAEAETGRWYNSLDCVGDAGSQFIAFLEHAAATADDSHCSLVRLDTIDRNSSTEKDTVIKIYQHGDEVEDDYNFPGAPPVPVCTRSRYTGLVIATQAESNAKSHVTGIKVTATWKRAKLTYDDEEEAYDYFPKTFDMDNTDNFELSGLEPNKEYEIKLAYIISLVDTVGPSSNVVTCKTAAMSAPRNPWTTKLPLQTDSITIAWYEPLQKETDDIKYQVSLATSEEDKIECIDSDVDAPGEYYRGSISTTENGEECLIWEDTHYTMADNPGRGLGHHNSCRNPDLDERPWCFTGIEGDDNWDYCAIPDCSTEELGKLWTIIRQIEVNQLDVSFHQLEVGQLYEVTIRAIYDGVAGDKVEFLAVTRPSPLSVPTVIVVEETAVRVSVNITTMSMEHAFSMDSIIVQYRKVSVSGGETMYGTEMTQTMPLIDDDASGETSVKEVYIQSLDSGSWYVIKAKVRVMLPNGGVLETDASEGIIVLTVKDPNKADSPLIEEINSFTNEFNSLQSNTNGIIENTQAKLNTADSIKNQYTSMSTDIRSAENKIAANAQVLEPVTSALLRQSCVKRGVKFSDFTPGSTSSYKYKLSDVANEFDCLESCEQRYGTNFEAVRFAHEPSPEAGECVCLDQRSGGITELNGFFTSINRWCWDTLGASSEMYASCTQLNTHFEGADLWVTSGVASIVDCVRLCTEEKGCLSIVYTYSESQGHDCCLKNSAPASTQAKTGYSTISMSCLMGDDSTLA